MIHGMSIDVEDYRQTLRSRYRGEDGPIRAGFQADMERVLEVLANGGAKATFFVTGPVARDCGGLLRQWSAAGHELACHGWLHEPIWRMDAKTLRQDVLRSKQAIEDASGTAVTGYRAPIFSITKQTLWALDVLASCGLRYDSSVMPCAGRRYGIGGFSTKPVRMNLSGGASPNGAGIVEVPLGLGRFAGKERPMSGGGHFRLFSARRVLQAVGRYEQAGQPFVVYAHPDEFSAEPFSVAGLAVRMKDRLSARLIEFKTNIGRAKVPATISQLLKAHKFGTLAALAAEVR